VSYAIDIKEKAFQLFVQGASLEEISQETKVNKKTILRWKKNEGWAPRREKILEEIQAKNDTKQVEMMTQLYEMTVKLWQETSQELKEMSRFRTKEGAVAAYMQMANMIMRLQPSKKEIKIDDVLGKVLKVLFDHPKIGIVLDKYKDEIVANIEKELAGAH